MRLHSDGFELEGERIAIGWDNRKHSVAFFNINPLSIKVEDLPSAALTAALNKDKLDQLAKQILWSMTRDEVLRQMIADYQKKIELYQTMIAEWQRELGVSITSSPINGSAGADVKPEKKQQLGGDVLSMIREWQFFNKSQPEAARLVLEIVGHPLTTQQIIDALEKGGLKIGGKSPADKRQNFYTILARNKELGKAGRGTWGLMSWPNITRPGKDDDDSTEPKAADEKTKAE